MMKIAKETAKTYWGLDFNIEISINDRLTSSRGRYRRSINRLTGKTTKQWIEMSGHMLKYEAEENIIKTLKHEVCHWACFNLGKPHKDGDRFFESELIRIGSHATRTMSRLGDYYSVICSKCGIEVASAKTEAGMVSKAQNFRYTSRCCRARLAAGGFKSVSRVITAAETVKAIPTPQAASNDLISLDELCKQKKLDPKMVRRKLRNGDFTKEGSSWMFTQSRFDEIMKSLGL